jgi:hypothetical protein
VSISLVAEQLRSATNRAARRRVFGKAFHAVVSDSPETTIETAEALDYSKALLFQVFGGQKPLAFEDIARLPNGPRDWALELLATLCDKTIVARPKLGSIADHLRHLAVVVKECGEFAAEYAAALGTHDGAIVSEERRRLLKEGREARTALDAVILELERVEAEERVILGARGPVIDVVRPRDLRRAG